MRKPETMPKHRILLVEELVLSDSAEFTVECGTTAEAASQLIKARLAGLDEDNDTVRLPDGQSAVVKPENIVRSRIFCMLLDENGNQIERIEPSDTALGDCGSRPPSPAAAAENDREPHWLCDPKE